MQIVMKAGHRPWLVASVALLVGACSGDFGDFFEVDNPGEITEEELENPALIEALTYAPPAVAADIYGSGAVMTGNIADDIQTSGTNFDWIRLDLGVLREFNVVVDGYYDDLVSSRWQATDAVERLKRLLPDDPGNPAIGRGYFWDAIIRIVLADLYDFATFDAGPPIPPLELYEMALQLLADASQIAQDAGDDLEYRAAIHATIARVHRSLFFELGDPDQLAQAAAQAAQALALAPDFRLNVIYQTPASSNPVFTSIGDGFGNTASGERFAAWRDPVTGELDPRIEIADEPIGFGTRGAYYHEEKYPDRDADLPLSRWQEARLILAEHELLLGNLTQALNHINAVRQAAGLPAFEEQAPDEIREQLIYERETEFWLEFRNWQDKRYYGVFPERWTLESREQGHQRLPISIREQNSNPHLSGGN